MTMISAARPAFSAGNMRARPAISSGKRCHTKTYFARDSNVAQAVANMSPERRRMLLPVVDSLLMELRKSELKPGKTQDGGAETAPAQPMLGVVMLDYDYEPAIGDIDHPGSYSYPVMYKKVPGLTFEACQAGARDPQVVQNFKDAVKWLVDQGCDAITGDCGFMYWYQDSARAITDRPMLLSALCQLPAITPAFADNEQIAIFTANGESLTPMLDLIKTSAGVDLTEDRFLIVGCEDVPGFDAVANGDKVIYDTVAPGIVQLAKKTLADNPAIKAFLFECTELPQFADAVRSETGLPVYSSITCADAFMSGLMDNPRFGLNDWQEESDDVQEKRSKKAGKKHHRKAKKVEKASVEQIVSSLNVLSA